MDRNDIWMRKDLKACANTFRRAAEGSYESGSMKLTEAIQTVYDYTSLDHASEMLRYPHIGNAFFILQGAANHCKPD